jgi:hypothetical protein
VVAQRVPVFVHNLPRRRDLLIYPSLCTDEISRLQTPLTWQFNKYGGGIYQEISPAGQVVHEHSSVQRGMEQARRGLSFLQPGYHSAECWRIVPLYTTP